MSLDPDLQKLLAPMAERDVSPNGLGFRVDRARVVARLAGTGARSRLGWRAWSAVAVAGALMLVVGARLWPRAADPAASLEVAVLAGHATQARAGATADVPRGPSARIPADGELETAADSQARVRTAEGLEIELRGRTRVALGELRARPHRVTLLGGAIRCTVPRRAEADAFQVATADVTVVDLGTVFTVDLEGPSHATRVSVEEGEVLIRHATGQTRVRAPGTWPRTAFETNDAAPFPGAPRAPSPMPAAKGERSLAKGARGTSTPPGTLDEEARLLRVGLAAERQGRPSEAVAALRELLAQYPRSPLAHDARDALMRVEAAGARP